MAMLGTLQTGQWDIRYREGSAATRLCVRTGREFIQLKHGGAGACSGCGVSTRSALKIGL